MLNFSNQDLPAQVIALHYAKQMNNQLAQNVFMRASDVTTAADAEALTLFFWAMADCAAEDENDSVEIEGITDLQYWMQRLMNIIAGYLNLNGFSDIWTKASDIANGR